MSYTQEMELLGQINIFELEIPDIKTEEEFLNKWSIKEVVAPADKVVKKVTGRTNERGFITPKFSMSRIK